MCTQLYMKTRDLGDIMCSTIDSIDDISEPFWFFGLIDSSITNPLEDIIEGVTQMLPYISNLTEMILRPWLCNSSDMRHALLSKITLPSMNLQR